MPSGMSDKSLCAMAADPQLRDRAFRMIIQTHGERLYTFVRSLVPGHQDADDVLQNTLVKVFRFLHTFEQKSSLYTWMHRIAWNEALAFLARERTRKIAGKKVLDTWQEGEEPESVALYSDQILSLLQEGIARLPERQRMVFQLRYFAEMPYQEMAELLQVSTGALKASFHHALIKLNHYVKQQVE